MVKETYFEANTYGIGQLITQRKMFVVPEHQRDFAWTMSDVEVFFDDIANAIQNNDPDYFIGLIVMLGPQDNKWTILDGQQRLVTTTMIYSAIRNWLWNRGIEQDASQIESEFIAVRILGGGYVSRFSPNITNREMFNDTVVEKCPEVEVRDKIEKTSRYSSNRLLLEANLLCRQKVNDFVSRNLEDVTDQNNKLFSLANYLETRVDLPPLTIPL